MFPHVSGCVYGEFSFSSSSVSPIYRYISREVCYFVEVFFALGIIQALGFMQRIVYPNTRKLSRLGQLANFIFVCSGWLLSYFTLQV